MSRVFITRSSTGIGLMAGQLPATAEESAEITGKYYYHMRAEAPNPDAADPAKQDQLIRICGEMSGIGFPWRHHVYNERKSPLG